MRPKTKRKLQLLVALTIYGIAAILSYFSVVEADEGKDGRFDIYLVLDVSGSMSSPDKIGALRNAAVNFIDTLNLSLGSGLRVGIVTYESDAHHLIGLTSEQQDLIALVLGLSAGGSTAMGDGMKISVDHLIQEGNASANWIILLMTDGWENNSHLMLPLPAADYAAQNHITVHCVGFGDHDEDLLRKIAKRTGGKYYYASTGSELIEIFGLVASSLVSPLMHYGSRALMLVALPLILFLPEIQEGMTTIYRTLMRKPTRLRAPELRGLRCPECGHLNRSTARFCGACRASLVAVGRPCPECGYVNRVGARFCGGCGTRLREIGG